jgi:type VI secretion system protein ImpH
MLSPPPPSTLVNPAGRKRLLRRLVAEAPRFDALQAAYLLHRLLPADDIAAGRLRVRPSPPLSFPGADVRRIEWSPDAPGEARLTLTFLGLCGTDAPVPPWMQEAAAREDDGAPLRAFLDLFHHRLHALFYRAWTKYRPTLRGVRGRAAHIGRLYALAGLPARPARRAADRPPAGPSPLLALAGSLRLRPRTPGGLRDLVAGLLAVGPVRVEEYAARWVTLRPRPRIGGRADRLRIGQSGGVLGRRAFDRAGAVRLHLGPLSQQAFRALSPGGPRARRLRALVGFYLPDGLACTVVLRLRAGAVPRVVLGRTGACLGRGARVGRAGGPVARRAEVRPRGEAFPPEL